MLMLKTMQYPIVIAFTFSTMLSHIACAPVTSYGDSASNNINGQTLIDVGSKFNISILEVIGKAIKNIENDDKEPEEDICRHYPCNDWSEWSDCDVSADKYGEVGAKSRTRICGGNTTHCERYKISKLVYAYEVCEKVCPTDYTVTKNGFCLKYYAGPKTWDEAEAMCRTDGGHLVHVDSEIKAHDVNITLAANSLSGISFDKAWIDGRRSVQGGSWAYGYKSTDSSFVYWGDNDPDNGATELCMVYQRNPYADSNMWRWYDYI
ncbi:versican core protein-like [Mercenaria mercenaria]|uniref:versican core protein-like n=1 Tax=Mercenaria mercenaria TaxID=6596 RepID=UPI00234F8347|nr:versican core protein-like [Mercenaria mercenaria]